MNEWYNVDFTAQGWQCPICKRVYSPTTPMCYYCGNSVPYMISSTTVSDVIDYLHHESEMKTKKPKENGEANEQEEDCRRF